MSARIRTAARASGLGARTRGIRSVGSRSLGVLAVITLLVVFGAPAGAGEEAAAASEPWSELALPDEDAGIDARARFPYTRGQLDRILELHRARHRALGLRHLPAGRRTRSISLVPGNPEPAGPDGRVSAARGYVTALVFLDVTGAPWPVSRVLMRPEFRVDDPARPRADHVVYLAPHRLWDHGNVTVELAGQPLPVSLPVLVDDAGPVDEVVVVRLPEPGPRADLRALAAPVRLAAGEPALDLFATGTPPGDAIRLAVEDEVTGAVGPATPHRAWFWREQVWLKTPDLVLAPAAHGAARGPDGTWIHMLPDTPLVLVSSRRTGATRRLRLARLPVAPVPVPPAPAIPAKHPGPAPGEASP